MHIMMIQTPFILYDNHDNWNREQIVVTFFSVCGALNSLFFHYVSFVIRLICENRIVVTFDLDTNERWIRHEQSHIQTELITIVFCWVFQKNWICMAHLLGLNDNRIKIVLEPFFFGIDPRMVSIDNIVWDCRH